MHMRSVLLLALALGAAADLDLAKLLPDPAKLLPTLHRRSLQQGDGANSCNHAYDGFCDEIDHPNAYSSACPAGTDASDCDGSSEGSGHQCTAENNYCEYCEPGSSTEWTFSSTNESVVDVCGKDACVTYVKYLSALFNPMYAEATVELYEFYEMCASDTCKEAFDPDSSDLLCNVSNHCGADMLKDIFDMAVGNMSSAAFMTDHMSTICGNAECKEAYFYSNPTDADALCDIYNHCGEDIVTDAVDAVAASNGSTTSSAAQADFVADHASTICGNAHCKEAYFKNMTDDEEQELNAFCDVHDHCGEDMLADMITTTGYAFHDSVASNETIRAFYIDNAIAVCGSADCKQAHHDAGLQSGAVEIMEEVCAAGQVILIVATVVPIVGVCCIGICIGLLLYAAAARPPANSPTPHPPPARPPARARAGRPPPAPLPQGLLLLQEEEGLVRRRRRLGRRGPDRRLRATMSMYPNRAPRRSYNACTRLLDGSRMKLYPISAGSPPSPSRRTRPPRTRPPPPPAPRSAAPRAARRRPIPRRRRQPHRPGRRERPGAARG